MDSNQLKATTTTPLGLWDPVGQCWLGNAAGPFKYTGSATAQAAALIAGTRMRYRIHAKPMDEEAFTKKDEVTPPLNLAEAFAEIAKGNIP
jgi:hypothetical protein